MLQRQWCLLTKKRKEKHVFLKLKRKCVLMFKRLSDNFSILCLVWNGITWIPIIRFCFSGGIQIQCVRCGFSLLSSTGTFRNSDINSPSLGLHPFSYPHPIVYIPVSLRQPPVQRSSSSLSLTKETRIHHFRWILSLVLPLNINPQT